MGCGQSNAVRDEPRPGDSKQPSSGKIGSHNRESKDVKSPKNKPKVNTGKTALEPPAKDDDEVEQTPRARGYSTQAEHVPIDPTLRGSMEMKQPPPMIDSNPSTPLNKGKKQDSPNSVPRLMITVQAASPNPRRSEPTAEPPNVNGDNGNTGGDANTTNSAAGKANTNASSSAAATAHPNSHASAAAPATANASSPRAAAAASSSLQQTQSQQQGGGGQKINPNIQNSPSLGMHPRTLGLGSDPGTPSPQIQSRHASFVRAMLKDHQISGSDEPMSKDDTVAQFVDAFWTNKTGKIVQQVAGERAENGASPNLNSARSGLLPQTQSNASVSSMVVAQG